MTVLSVLVHVFRLFRANLFCNSSLIFSFVFSEVVLLTGRLALSHFVEHCWLCRQASLPQLQAATAAGPRPLGSR
jgi:hypothetical protein